MFRYVHCQWIDFYCNGLYFIARISCTERWFYCSFLLNSTCFFFCFVLLSSIYLSNGRISIRMTIYLSFDSNRCCSTIYNTKSFHFHKCSNIVHEIFGKSEEKKITSYIKKTFKTILKRNWQIDRKINIKASFFFCVGNSELIGI